MAELGQLEVDFGLQSRSVDEPGYPKAAGKLAAGRTQEAVLVFLWPQGADWLQARLFELEWVELWLRFEM